MIKLFSKTKGHSYSLDEIDKGHHKITYRGIPCIKCPFDYVIYQMIFSELKPDLIIEIGTNKGGSALYYADLLDSIGKGVIHTIDIKDECGEMVKNHPRIKIFTEGWERYDLNRSKGYETILLIEDSSHTYANTLGAMQKFAPLVTKGSYLIVEDGIIDALGRTKQYQGGPVRAIKEFLAENREFIPDDRWENFFGKSATFNTMGYLKRI